MIASYIYLFDCYGAGGNAACYVTDVTFNGIKLLLTMMLLA